MANFLEHLEREGDPLVAAMSWIETLNSKGIILQPAALPDLMNFQEKDKHIMKTIAAPGYSTIEEFLEDIHAAKLPLEFSRLMKNPFPTGIQINHNMALAKMRSLGTVKAANPLEESVQYIKQLRHHGINLQEGVWKEVLPHEHHDLIKDPEKEVELYAASGRFVTRCPGWVNIHPNRAVFRLENIWYDHPLLRNRIETYEQQKRFEFTDTICDDCATTFSLLIKQ